MVKVAVARNALELESDVLGIGSWTLASRLTLRAELGRGLAVCLLKGRMLVDHPAMRRGRPVTWFRLRISSPHRQLRRRSEPSLLGFEFRSRGGLKAVAANS